MQGSWWLLLFKLNNYCVGLQCSMHNAHVIYVCTASVLVRACLPIVLRRTSTLCGHGEAQISATFMFAPSKHNWAQYPHNWTNSWCSLGEMANSSNINLQPLCGILLYNLYGLIKTPTVLWVKIIKRNKAWNATIKVYARRFKLWWFSCLLWRNLAKFAIIIMRMLTDLAF